MIALKKTRGSSAWFVSSEGKSAVPSPVGTKSCDGEGGGGGRPGHQTRCRQTKTRHRHQRPWPWTQSRPAADHFTSGPLEAELRLKASTLWAHAADWTMVISSKHSETIQ